MSNMYEDAIASQSASNLTALVHSLARHLNTIWEEARAKGLGTDYVNTHPAVKLFVHQMHYLAWKQGDSYSVAYQTCCEKQAEGR